MARRLVQLYAGLLLYGFSMALQIRAGLGLDPWDVFHQGVATRTGWTFGTVTIVVGAVVLLAWIPMRQRPGLGTLSNVVVIGLAVDASLWLVGVPSPTWAKWAMLLLGVGLNGLASACYIGAGLGPGPRDGLTTGLVRITGRPLRLVRTLIEVAVLGSGWLLGGTVGIGTLVYALAIGPLIHLFLPWLTVAPPAMAADTPVGAGPDRQQRPDEPLAA